MKTNLAVASALMIILSLSSCENKATMDAATAQSDSLQVVLKEKDRIIEETFSDIEEIASSLSQISEREKFIVSASSGEISQNTKKKIANHIAAISELLQKNRETIARLSSSAQKLKAANLNIASLDSLVNSLQSQIQLKDSELFQMSENLTKLKIEITELQGLNQTLSEQKVSLESTVAAQTTDLNTVYWVMNTESELRKDGIVDKKGFIGRTLVLKDVANLDNFTRSDMRSLDRIAIDRKGVKMVSAHPESAYELVVDDNKRVQELVITNKEAFWKTSKILVISYSK